MKLTISKDLGVNNIRNESGDVVLTADSTATANAIVTVVNVHERLVAALTKIAKNDPFKQSSAGILARSVLTEIGVAV